MTSKELEDLVISALLLALAFGIALSGGIHAFFDPRSLLIVSLKAVVSVSLGFVLHEMGHRFVARRFDCFAQYTMWPIGLMLALALSLFGFIFAALFLGYFVDKYIRARNFLSMFCLMLFANFCLIYIPGLIQLSLWLGLVKGETPGLYQLLTMGLFPFIAGDVIKLLVAASVTRGITPKRAYGNEVDEDKLAGWRIP